MNRQRLLMTGLITLCILADRPAAAAFVAIDPSGSVSRTQTTEFTPAPSATTTYVESSRSNGSFTAFNQIFRGRGDVITLTQRGEFIVKFDLTSLAGADITAATLDFTATSASSIAGLSVSGLGSSTADARQADFSGGTTVVVPGGFGNYTLDAVPTNRPLSFDASFLRALVQAGVPAVAFRFVAIQLGGSNGVSGGLTILPPRLNVTFQTASVPEPASLVLCSLAGIGLLSVGVVRRRSGGPR